MASYWATFRRKGAGLPAAGVGPGVNVGGVGVIVATGVFPEAGNRLFSSTANVKCSLLFSIGFFTWNSTERGSAPVARKPLSTIGSIKTGIFIAPAVPWRLSEDNCRRPERTFCVG